MNVFDVYVERGGGRTKIREGCIVPLELSMTEIGYRRSRNVIHIA